MEEIILGIKVDTAGSNQSIGQLEDSLKLMKQKLKELPSDSKGFTTLQNEIKKSEAEIKNLTKGLDNSFLNLNKQIKGAKAELDKFKPGTAEYRDAAERLNELKERMGEVGDAAKISGNGIERINKSFSLFGEALAGADINKAKIAFDGLRGAMSALPIFAIVEGIKLLIENFDEVITFMDSFTESAKKNKQAMNELNQAYSDVNANLDEIQFKEEEYVRNSEQRNKLLVDLATRRGAKDKEIRDLEIKGNADKLGIISKAEENYRRQRDFAEAQLTKAFKTNDEEVIKNAQETFAKAEALYKTSVNKRKDLSNELALAEQKNITETLLQYRKNQEEIQKLLQQLGLQRIKSEEEREIESVKIKYEAYRKDFRNKEATTEQKKKLEEDYEFEIGQIQLKFANKRTEDMKKRAKQDEDILEKLGAMQEQTSQEIFNNEVKILDSIIKANQDNAKELIRLNKEKELKIFDNAIQVNLEKQKELLDGEISSLNTRLEAEKNILTTAEKKVLEDLIKLKEENRQKLDEITEKSAKERVAIEAKYAKQIEDVDKRLYDKKLSNLTAFVNASTQILSSFAALQASIQEGNLIGFENQQSQELEAFEKSQKAKEIIIEQAGENRSALEKNLEIEREEFARQQADREREFKKKQATNALKIQAITAIAEIASAIVAAQKLLPPLNIAEGIRIAALGITQIAAINSSLNRINSFAKGGVIQGPSHKDGGVKFAVGGQVNELEGGEGVINKRSMAMPGIAQAASFLNQMGGGVAFANGGTTSTNNQMLALASIINNKPQMIEAYVLEGGVTRAQKNSNKIRNRAKF